MNEKNPKVYTSSIPEVAAKQRERMKTELKQELPIIVELLLEDDVLLGQLAEAIGEKLGTKKMKITNTSGEDNPKK